MWDRTDDREQAEAAISDRIDELEAENQRLKAAADVHINEYRSEKERADALKAENKRMQKQKEEAYAEVAIQVAKKQRLREALKEINKEAVYRHNTRDTISAYWLIAVTGKALQEGDAAP